MEIWTHARIVLKHHKCSCSFPPRRMMDQTRKSHFCCNSPMYNLASPSTFAPWTGCKTAERKCLKQQRDLVWAWLGRCQEGVTVDDEMIRSATWNFHERVVYKFPTRVWHPRLSLSHTHQGCFDTNGIYGPMGRMFEVGMRDYF